MDVHAINVGSATRYPEPHFRDVDCLSSRSMHILRPRLERDRASAQEIGRVMRRALVGHGQERSRKKKPAHAVLESARKGQG
jgi:hypothetical protein